MKSTSAKVKVPGSRNLPPEQTVEEVHDNLAQSYISYYATTMSSRVGYVYKQWSCRVK